MLKAVKWLHMLPDALNQIQDTINQGWDVGYCDGSRKGTSGVLHAGYSLWFVLGDEHNTELTLQVDEKQTI